METVTEAQNTEVKLENGAADERMKVNVGDEPMPMRQGLREWKVPCKTVKNAKIRKALLEVYRRKQSMDSVNYKEIAEMHEVNANTLREYWCRFTKGMLDLGVGGLALSAAHEPKDVHEKQLNLLRRMQAILVLTIDEGVKMMERDARKRQAGFSKTRKTMKNYGVMELFRSLDTVCRMLSATEKGYMAALDLLTEKLRSIEKQAHGKEVHATIEKMSESELVMRALREARERKAQAGEFTEGGEKNGTPTERTSE